jgi:DivIVA domain-containing protein
VRWLRAQEVTSVRFRRARWFRIGLDAADVRAFLARIADALAAQEDVERALRMENAQLWSENERIKTGLSRWQAEQPSR